MLIELTDKEIGLINRGLIALKNKSMSIVVEIGKDMKDEKRIIETAREKIMIMQVKCDRIDCDRLAERLSEENDDRIIARDVLGREPNNGTIKG